MIIDEPKKEIPPVKRVELDDSFHFDDNHLNVINFGKFDLVLHLLSS